MSFKVTLLGAFNVKPIETAASALSRQSRAPTSAKVFAPAGCPETMGSSASVGQSERASFNSVEIQASNRGSFDLPFGASLRDLPATVPEAAAAAGLGFGASTPVSPGALRRGLAVTHSDRGSPWEAPRSVAAPRPGLEPPSPATPGAPGAVLRPPAAAAADEERRARRAFGSRKSFQRIHHPEEATPDAPTRSVTPTDDSLATFAAPASLASFRPKPKPRSATEKIVEFDKAGYLGEHQRRKGFNSRESFDNFLRVDETVRLDRPNDPPTPRDPLEPFHFSHLSFQPILPSPVGSFG